VPVIVHTYHGHALTGYFGGLKAAIFLRIEALLGRLTDVLVTVSEAVKQDLVALGVAPAAQIRVIPLGLDLERLAGALPRGSLRSEAAFPDDAPLVGIVGRLVAIKDLPTFLRAAVRVREVRPEVRFSVVGDGEEREATERLTRELGLASAVFFHGWRRDMAAVYGDLDLVVNCSLNEGTPVALIEALAAARPVVATAVGGTPDLLGGGSRGILVPPGDPQELASAMLTALAERNEFEARRQAGREQVLALHSVERLVNDIDQLYREQLALRVREVHA
jgi:glycosyltransferase involved in cell wall biosynthesis